MTDPFVKLSALDASGEVPVYINANYIESIIPDPEMEGCTQVFTVTAKHPYYIIGSFEEIAENIFRCLTNK